jgi:hypothetical protein
LVSLQLPVGALRKVVFSHFLLVVSAHTH